MQTLHLFKCLLLTSLIAQNVQGMKGAPGLPEEDQKALNPPPIIAPPVQMAVATVAEEIASEGAASLDATPSAAAQEPESAGPIPEDFYPDWQLFLYVSSVLQLRSLLPSFSQPVWMQLLNTADVPEGMRVNGLNAHQHVIQQILPLLDFLGNSTKDQLIHSHVMCIILHTIWPRSLPLPPGYLAVGLTYEGPLPEGMTPVLLAQERPLRDSAKLSALLNQLLQAPTSADAAVAFYRQLMMSLEAHFSTGLLHRMLLRLLSKDPDPKILHLIHALMRWLGELHVMPNEETIQMLQEVVMVYIHAMVVMQENGQEGQFDVPANDGTTLDPVLVNAQVDGQPQGLENLAMAADLPDVENPAGVTDVPLPLIQENPASNHTLDAEPAAALGLVIGGAEERTKATGVFGAFAL